LFVDILINC
jgi:peroxin-6